MVPALVLGISALLTPAGALIWPPPPKEPNPISQLQTVNITAFNSTALPYNDTSLVDNVTLPANATALFRNWTRLLVASLPTADNDTVYLEPVVPPLLSIAKRKAPVGDYDERCEAARPDFESIGIAADSPIRYTHSYCVQRWSVTIICEFIGLDGRAKGGWTFRHCAPEERCIEYNDGHGLIRAWCAQTPTNSARVVRDGGEGLIRVRSQNPSTQNVVAVNEYWNADTGMRREVQNTTFVTSTPDHDRIEFIGYKTDYAQSKPAWMGFGEGWDIYVTPGQIEDGWTIIDTSLQVLT